MVSVIIPTHKRANLLFYELERIYNQKNVEIEVVVVNDIEEEDETDRITELFPDVIYIKSSQIQGPSEKHKKGFSITTGEYVYMPDDDDYLIDEHFFEKAEKKFQNDSTISLVSGNVNIRYEDENHVETKTIKQKLNISGKINGFEYLQEFQHRYTKPASTVSTLFRRNALNGNMIEMSDSSLYIQALFGGDAFIMDDIVAVYRVRSIKGHSLTSSASLPFIINVLKQKEQFYFRAKEVLQYPKNFWSCHFIATFSLLANKPNSRNERVNLVRWGFAHSHGSLRMIFFLVKQIVILLFRNEK